MNILIATNQLSIGGAEHFVVRLSNQLVRRGHQVVVAAAPGELSTLLNPAVTTVMMPMRPLGPPQGARTIGALRWVIDAHDIQVIHANSFNTALFVRAAREDRSVPIIMSAHGAWRAWKKPVLARVLGSTADYVVGCSAQVMADLVRNGLPAQRARAICNGIEFPQASVTAAERADTRRELGCDADRPLILGVGRLANQKGFAHLLEAMVYVRRVVPAARLAIAGDGELATELRALAERLDLGHSVCFLGARSDVPRLLAAADIFCLPSLDEGLPLAILEAMAHRLPVVATRVGGVAEAVLDGRTGWLVPPADPVLLASRLVALLDDGPRREAMGLAGWAHAAANFTLDRMVSQFECLYREAAEALSQPIGQHAPAKPA